MSTPPKIAILNELWTRGTLSWKLHEGQREIYNLYNNSTSKVNVWLLGRRTGKTFGLCVLALEECLKNPRSIVKIVSATKTQVEQNIQPVMADILKDCPANIKPKYNAKKYAYIFSNGSEIQLAGSDSGHAERLRGINCQLAIVDEAGSCQDLENIVKSILIPTTLLTRGKVILASTPPREADHDFLKFIEAAEANGTLIKKPSSSNPMLTPDMLEELIESVGGIHSDAYRREVLCDIIKDPSLSVIPEFTPELEATIVKDNVKPPFYDAYVAMDLGFRDLTAVLFGYFDFRNDRLIIEDELIMNFQEEDMNLPVLIKGIQDKEFANFIDIKTNEQKKPLRVSDLNPIVTQEIARQSNYQVYFTNANKQEKEATLNKVRMMLSNGKIWINPKCETLVRHLRNARWASNNGKKTFSRSEGNGHYDTLDALCYLVSAVNYTKNPYPAHFDMNNKDLFVRNSTTPKPNNNNYIEIYNKVFNLSKINIKK